MTENVRSIASAALLNSGRYSNAFSRGMRDMLPADMERFRRIELTFRDVCLGWGYEEVRTPTLEQMTTTSGRPSSPTYHPFGWRWWR